MIRPLAVAFLLLPLAIVAASAQPAPGGAPTPAVESAIRRPRAAWASSDARAVIENGLAWLARHQEKDGFWSPAAFSAGCAGDAVCDGNGMPDYQAGITGLAALALLGYGAVPGRELMVKDEVLGSSPNLSDAAARALRWLRGQVRPDGMVGAPSSKLMYNQAIAAFALVEGYALTGEVELKDAAQRSVDFLAAARTPKKGWRYTPGTSESDSSVTGWCVTALYLARLSGLTVPADAFAGARAFLEESTNERGETGYTSVRDAGVKVVVPGKNEDFAYHPTLSAMALFARHLIEGKKLDARYRQAAVKLLTDDPPRWDVGKRLIDYYYWYHAAEALHQAGGSPEAAKAWQKSLVASLTLGQGRDKKSCTHGSWSADTSNGIGRWAFEGGRVYTTAIAVLALETPIRYAALPLLDALPDTSAPPAQGGPGAGGPPAPEPLTEAERAQLEDWVVGIGGPATATVEASILRFGPRAAEVVRARLRDPDATVRRRVRELLANLGAESPSGGGADPGGGPVAPDPGLPPEYATPNTRFMDRYKEDLKSGDVVLRERAVGALAALKTSYAAEPLVAALAAEEQGVLRTRMVDALVTIERAAVAREARKAAGAKPAADPALRLLELLKRCDDVDSQRISVLLLFHADKGVGTAAAAALRANRKNAIPVLVEAVRGTQGVPRQTLIAVLGEIGDPRAVPFLCSLCQPEPVVNPEREAATAALARIGLPAAPGMIEALASTNRKVVVGTLRQITGQSFQDDQIEQWKGWLKENRKEIEAVERKRFEDAR